jgi:hypothetical protein
MLARDLYIWVVSGAALASCSSMPNAAKGPVLLDDFETMSGSLVATMPDDPRLKVVDGDGVDGGRALRVEYVGGPMGSERLVGSFPLPPADEYTLNYDVRFGRDFQFVLGGKLHGFGPKRPVTGGRPLHPSGWSARVMWRENGRAETYTYHQDQQGRYGEAGAANAPFRFQPDRYYAVSLHVKINGSSGSRNGFVRLYIDGVLVESREDLRLRATNGSVGSISAFLFSTFHGGNAPERAPRGRDGGYTNEIAYFDNFAVHAGEHVRRRPGS